MISQIYLLQEKFLFELFKFQRFFNAGGEILKLVNTSQIRTGKFPIAKTGSAEFSFLKQKIQRLTCGLGLGPAALLQINPISSLL